MLLFLCKLLLDFVYFFLPPANNVYNGNNYQTLKHSSEMMISSTFWLVSAWKKNSPDTTFVGMGFGNAVKLFARTEVKHFQGSSLATASNLMPPFSHKTWHVTVYVSQFCGFNIFFFPMSAWYLSLALLDFLYIFLWCPRTSPENCTRIQINFDTF